jgi:hypothetical protein
MIPSKERKVTDPQSVIIDLGAVRFLNIDPKKHLFRFPYRTVFDPIGPETDDDGLLNLIDAKILAAIIDALGLDFEYNSPSFRRHLSAHLDIIGTLALPKFNEEPMCVVCKNEEMVRGDFVRRLHALV